MALVRVGYKAPNLDSSKQWVIQNNPISVEKNYRNMIEIGVGQTNSISNNWGKLTLDEEEGMELLEKLEKLLKRKIK